MGAGRTDEPQANQRLTVAQAAARLGITEGTVRSRIKRGTLPATKEGRAVFVLLGDGTSQANQTPNDGKPTDQSKFVAQILDRVASLERQLQRREDETERLHQIIGRLTQTNAVQARTIRELEAPASEEPTEDAETVEEAPERAEPRPDAAGPQRGFTSPRQNRKDERVLRAFRELADRDPNAPVAVHEVREIANVPGLGDEVLDRLQHEGYIAQVPDRPDWFAITDEGYKVASNSEPRGWWRRVFGA